MQKNQVSQLFWQVFKCMDLFKKPVQLLIKKEEFHKTTSGAVLSIILIFFMGILLYNSLTELFHRTNPTSLTTEVYHSQPEQYKLSSNNFTLTFGLQTADFKTYMDESIYVVKANLVQKTTSIVNNSNQAKWVSTPIKLTQCTPELIRQQELKDYYLHLALSTKYCIDWNSVDFIKLEGTFDAPVFTFVELVFNICTEKTRRPNGPECKSREEIQQALEKNIFSFQLSSNIINLKNPTNPHKPREEGKFTTISSKIYKEIMIYLQPLTTITDFGLFQEDEQIIKTLKYGRHTETMDMNEDDNFLNVDIRLDKTESVNYRQYPKLQQIFGQLGGLWNIIFLIALAIQKPISNITYQLSLINSLFNFEGIDTQQQHQVDEVDEGNNLHCSAKGMSRSLTSLRTQNKAAQQRLHSIIIKNRQHECMMEGRRKLSMSQALSHQIKNYFKLVSQKIHLNCKDYIYFLKCCCKAQGQKQQQIEFATQKLKKQCDLIYIIKKLQEIDKLKMILLNREQIKVFDYLPKPNIPMNINDQFQHSQYFSILKPSKSTHQMAAEAQQAFKYLLENPQIYVNQRLIQSMDEDIMELLKINVQDIDIASSESINFEDSQRVEFPKPSICKFKLRSTSK